MQEDKAIQRPSQSDMDDWPLLVNFSGVARVLGCSRGLVYHRMHKGVLPFPVLRVGETSLRVPLLAVLEYGGYDTSFYHARVDALPRLIPLDRIAEELDVPKRSIRQSPQFPLKAVTTGRGSKFSKGAVIALLDTHKSCHAADSCSENDEHVSRRIRRSA